MEEITKNTQAKNCGVILVIIAALLCFPTLIWAGQFKVVRIYDGDTLQAIGHDIEIIVRLMGIDTPERSTGQQLDQPYSRQATEYLSSLVLGKIIELKGYGLDNFNQILGVVQFNGKNVNLEIVKKGYAEVCKDNLPETFNINPYEKAEKEDKKTGLGIWFLGDKYVSPAEWRKMHR